MTREITEKRVTPLEDVDLSPESDHWLNTWLRERVENAELSPAERETLDRALEADKIPEREDWPKELEWAMAEIFGQDTMS